MNQWIALIGGGVVTYLARGSFLLFAGNKQLPPVALRMLKYVSPAVFAAIVLPAVVGDKGMSRFVAPDPRLLAIAVGGLVAWKTKNIPLTLVIGMISLWLFEWSGL